MSVPPKAPPASKGILSLITGPENDNMQVSLPLHYVSHNPNACRMKKNAKRKSHKVDDMEQNQRASDYYHEAKTYMPCEAEFTLLFFCDLTCMNCRRFTFILADFMRAVRAQPNGYSDEKNTQLILVPNNKTVSNTGKKKSPSLLSHLETETEYWLLGYDNVNRLSLIRMLSISRVPTLVVISNKTGRIITSNGMEAIEWCEEGKILQVLESWRQGKPAVPITAYLGCNIS